MDPWRELDHKVAWMHNTSTRINLIIVGGICCIVASKLQGVSESQPVNDDYNVQMAWLSLSSVILLPLLVSNPIYIIWIL